MIRAWCATLVSNGGFPGFAAGTPPPGAAASLVIPWRLSDRSFAASLDRSLARPHLWPKPAAPHGTREHDDDNGQHSCDSTTQDHANDYVRDEVPDAVCLRPEVTDDPAAQ